MNASTNPFADAGIVVTPELLSTPRGDVPMRDIRQVFAQDKSPRLWPWLLVMAFSAAVGLPLVASWIAGGTASGIAAAVMAGFAGAMFLGIIRLLTFDAAYCVVIHRERGARVVFRSNDHQLVVSIVAAIEERRRSGPVT